jgi:thiaminase
MRFIQKQQQIELIIQKARQENFTDEEKVIFDDFIVEAGVKNPAKMTEASTDAFIRYLDSCEASNEFVANVVNRLAQVAPAHIMTKILLSDNDGDGVPLYQELQLGTKATEYDTPSEIAAARQRQYQFLRSQDSDMEI